MTNASDRSARVGLITDQTGALSFMGIANTNVARMVIDDINAAGGLLGRPVELFISTRTAEHHISHIYTKIGVGNRAAATRWAVQHRVVEGTVTA
jgi:hypothetical protein